MTQVPSGSPKHSLITDVEQHKFLNFFSHLKLLFQVKFKIANLKRKLNVNVSNRPNTSRKLFQIKPQLIFLF